LAGVPESVINESQQKLLGLEDQYVVSGKESEKKPTPQASLFPESRPEEQAVIARLKGTSPNDVTPRQALDLLYDLTKMLGKKTRK
ncbi:MAG: hypothetical protein KTR18_04385, partial [Acidiferrobacterales bacterium]|nr:hypothetical protein [Acidiferrobacterales bacterium]